MYNIRSGLIFVNAEYSKVVCWDGYADKWGSYTSKGCAIITRLVAQAAPSLVPYELSADG